MCCQSLTSPPLVARPRFATGGGFTWVPLAAVKWFRMVNQRVLVRSGSIFWRLAHPPVGPSGAPHTPRCAGGVWAGTKATWWSELWCWLGLLSHPVSLALTGCPFRVSCVPCWLLGGPTTPLAGVGVHVTRLVPQGFTPGVLFWPPKVVGVLVLVGSRYVVSPGGMRGDRVGVS